jgi:hypothetical protein
MELVIDQDRFDAIQMEFLYAIIASVYEDLAQAGTLNEHLRNLESVRDHIVF